MSSRRSSSSDNGLAGISVRTAVLFTNMVCSLLARGQVSPASLSPPAASAKRFQLEHRHTHIRRRAFLAGGAFVSLPASSQAELGSFGSFSGGSRPRRESRNKR